ncbi:iron-containing redox enzyme family protein [Myxococcus stipitatus]|uniref:iron-containing redox enzyme family protein n=1 Tax=Myxococcus stipitatus TaxID=83455 RepID=UPI0031451E7B
MSTQSSPQGLHAEVKAWLYTRDLESVPVGARNQLREQVDLLGRNAFQEGDEAALTEAHRVLYVINMAQLTAPWEVKRLNVGDPLFAQLKGVLEKCWHQASLKKYAPVLNSLPPAASFKEWVTQTVRAHPSNISHPIFAFLRDKATFEQLREFFLQETPLEVLFGDIIALMMPGVYGTIKLELAKNFWDEVGHAQDPRVHRNMRFDLMDYLELPRDIYTERLDLFVREELALVNMYMSMAMNRSRLTEILGALLATETMIPGRFEWQIQGWRRVGMADKPLAYHLEHTTVDVEHANAWMDEIIIPLLARNPAAMPELVLGIMLRLDTAGAVVDRLYDHVKGVRESSLGAYRGAHKVP